MEFLKILFLIILMAIIQATSTCGKAITCTAGDFPVGVNASLVCYFPDDIDNHESVLVQYYPFSAPTDASDVVLCKAEDVKASKCKEQDGYVLKSHTRNTLLVVIININEKAAGRYTCQFLPPDKSPREMCNLRVHGKTTGVTPTEVDVSQDSSTINIQSDETGTVSVGTLVGVSVAVVVVVAVIIIIIVVIVFHRRRKRLAEKISIQTQISEDRALAAPLINTQSSGTETLATGLAEKKSIQTQVSEDRTLEKRSIQTQVSVDGGLAVPLINTQSNVTKTPATGTVEKRSIQTQVSVDRALAAPLINTQSSGTETLATGLAEKKSIQTQVSEDRTVEKRSIQTQVSVDGGLAAPLINTQSNVTKTPATGTTRSTPVQDNSEMNCEMELARLMPTHKGQPKELVNSSDCLTERKNLDTILENVTADPHRNV